MGDSQPIETTVQQEIVQEEAPAAAADIVIAQNGDIVKDDKVLDKAEAEIAASLGAEGEAMQKPITITEFEEEDFDEVMMDERAVVT